MLQRKAYPAKAQGAIALRSARYEKDFIVNDNEGTIRRTIRKKEKGKGRNTRVGMLLRPVK
jgi:hypothetical protein